MIDATSGHHIWSEKYDRDMRDLGNYQPWLGYTGLAEVYSEMGRVEKAHAQALEILRINPSFSLEDWSKTEPFKDPKHLEKRLTAPCCADRWVTRTEGELAAI
ncbi:MAG TPA: hypothetical protein VMW91_08075 [Desulfosporosinus sp.]|nr:hypothetical protein [Desulfosporosinus sp.]